MRKQILSQQKTYFYCVIELTDISCLSTSDSAKEFATSSVDLSMQKGHLNGIAQDLDSIISWGDEVGIVEALVLIYLSGYDIMEAVPIQ